MTGEARSDAIRRQPRSYLYVPGDRDDLLVKATQRGADAVIADLEDAVPPAAKSSARDNVAAWLHDQDGGPERWVRVNAGPADLEKDIAAIAAGPALTGIVVAKIEEPRTLTELPSQLRLQPLIESARAVLAAAKIASGPGVERLQLGEADLSADLGTAFDQSDRILEPIRLHVVVASAAAGVEPPVGPVSTNFRDMETFERSTAALARLGFGARAVIHPAQVEIANRVFTPTPEEVEGARQLLDAATESVGGVFVDGNGRMVDEAVLRSARRVLARAEW